MTTYFNARLSGFLFLLLLSVGSALPSLAQLSVSGSGSYGIPLRSDGGSMLGAGLGVKYYFSSKLAAGLRVRGYLEDISRTEIGLDSKITALTIPLMATVEYHILDTDLNPYVGLEVGIVRTAVNTLIDFNNRPIYDETSLDTTLGIAPKIGASYDITQGLSVFAEALYNMNFSRDPAGQTQFNYARSTKFLTFHLGVSFTFGNRFD